MKGNGEDKEKKNKHEATRELKTNYTHIHTPLPPSLPPHLPSDNQNFGDVSRQALQTLHLRKVLRREGGREGGREGRKEGGV